MKVFCAVQATGRGHLSRYAVSREIYESAGHEVFGYSSGAELPPYAQGISRFDMGPTFFIDANRVDMKKSVLYNSSHMMGFFSAIGRLKQFLKAENFDEIVIDFEPLSARAVRGAGLPFTIFDNQTLSLLDLPTTAETATAVKLMRRFVRFYYGSVEDAKRILTYSFAPFKPQLPRQVIIPPCVRKEVYDLPVAQGNHILFYSSIGELPPGLVDFAKRNPDVEVRAYVQSPGKIAAPDNIRLPDRNGANFLKDFATCRAFVANAGFESLAEAIVLRKPVMIVPIQGQWEQQINANLIRHFGIGETAANFSAETFERAVRNETPPSDEVYQWVLQGRARLEAALVG